MASLQSLVSQNKKLVKGPDGSLQEVPVGDRTGDLQQLSGQAGLQAPPTDAASAAQIGASPQQQKMVGSPAQVQNAVRLASDPSQSLSTAVREQQARSQATQEEQATQKKAKDSEGLSTVGSRVTDFIDAQRKKLAAATVTPGTDVQVTATPGSVSGLPTDPTALATVKDAAKKLLLNPKDMDSLLALNKALGRDVDSQVKPEELQGLYASSTDTLAKSGAANVADSLHVEDLVNQGNLGYDLPTLSTLLNVPADQLSKMTVSQLRDAISTEQKNEFTRSSQNQAKATSAVLGSAEKATASQTGQELSRTGVRASEDDYNKLDQSMQNADQVQFGGKTYQVDQLLQDDTISGLIKDYLANPTSDDSKKLAASEPGLMQFIQNNQAVLKDAAAQMAAGTQQFSDIQTANKGVAKVGTTVLNDDLMKAIDPNWGQLSSTKFDPNTSPLFSTLNKMPAASKQAAGEEIQNLTQGNPDTAKDLAHLSSKELSSLQLDKGGTSPKIQAYTNNQKLQKQLASTSPDNPDAVVALATGGKIPDMATLKKIVDQNGAASVLGFSPAKGPLETKPGQPITSQALYAMVQKGLPKVSLKDVADGKNADYTPLNETVYSPKTPVEQTVMDKLGPLAQDGSLTAKEVQKAPLTEDDLFNIQSAGLEKSWGAAGKQIDDEVKQVQTGNTAKELAKFPVDIKSITDAINPQPNQVRSIPVTNPDGTFTSQDYATYSHDQIKNIIDTGDALAQNIASLQDRVKELKAAPSQAQRRDMDGLQGAIAKYQSLLDAVRQKQQELGSHEEIDPDDGQGIGQSGLPTTSSNDGGQTGDPTVNKVLSQVRPQNSVQNAVQTARNPVGYTKKLLG